MEVFTTLLSKLYKGEEYLAVKTRNLSDLTLEVLMKNSRGALVRMDIAEDGWSCVYDSRSERIQQGHGGFWMHPDACEETILQFIAQL